MGKVIPRASNTISDENTISSPFPSQIKEELPDDITYNEEWWKRYCQENKLDVTTGKSLRGSSSFRINNSLLF